MCQSCHKPETVTHFLTECTQGDTCSAVLAACNSLNVSPTTDTILSDSCIHDVTYNVFSG